MTADRKPWIEVARRVLAGAYDGCDKSTRESLILGLRSITDQVDCAMALEKLLPKPK